MQKHCGVRGQAFTNPTMRKDFTEGVIKTLKRNRPESLVSGLVRVDIMWSTYLNKMIVIELESLEVCHYYLNKIILYLNIFNNQKDKL